MRNLSVCTRIWHWRTSHQGSAGKAVKPPQRCWAANQLIVAGKLSISKSCAAVGLSRRAWYREDPAQKQLDRDTPVIDALNKLLEKHPRWGFWKYFYKLRRSGFSWNHKHVWQIYCAMNLNQKRRSKRRLPERLKTPLPGSQCYR